MKKVLVSLLLGASIFLAGCLETTQEITLNEDGSGSFKTTTDMGSVISLARQMGGAEEMNKAGDQKMDSTFTLGAMADSIPGLTTAEKQLAAKGNARIQMNLKEDKFNTEMTFPFSNPREIFMISHIAGKVMTSTINDKMGEVSSGAASEIPAQSTMENYYKDDFSNGELTRKVIKEKYDSVSKDEYLVGMKEAATMGLDMKSKLIINLPRPATKAEGKNVVLSEDKRKVTIIASLEDFFEDPTALEFKIKY